MAVSVNVIKLLVRDTFQVFCSRYLKADKDLLCVCVCEHPNNVGITDAVYLKRKPDLNRYMKRMMNLIIHCSTLIRKTLMLTLNWGKISFARAEEGTKSLQNRITCRYKKLSS